MKAMLASMLTGAAVLLTCCGIALMLGVVIGLVGHAFIDGLHFGWGIVE